MENNTREEEPHILEVTIRKLADEIGVAKADMALKDAFIEQQERKIDKLEERIKELEGGDED